ncbi:uncharacterized protein [Macrobrachium rosenbergii]|uniref:uncharacterized protein n=1 Tax=Macrobrachium rosenbergii TaxID=79674 RepID=UPI0034D58527
MKSAFLLFVAAAVAIVTVVNADTSVNENIDARNYPIAKAIAYLLLGLCPEQSVHGLLDVILKALDEPEFDYWGEVKDEVTKMVGDYINDHNIHEVEVYQKELQRLMDRYNNAPVISDGTYPNKNQMAVDLSTSIVLHRYLIEAAYLPQSMILHFEDIAAIHVLILKDAAETYSFPGYPPSKWWLDLDEELAHYIEYAEYLNETLLEWRTGMVSCDSHTSGKYVIYRAIDGVTGEESTCRELKGTGSCENHCDDFFEHKSIEVDDFLLVKMADVHESWTQLKGSLSGFINEVSEYHDPVNEI